jgi:hypothetical protein
MLKLPGSGLLASQAIAKALEVPNVYFILLISVFFFFFFLAIF